MPSVMQQEQSGMTVTDFVAFPSFSASNRIQPRPRLLVLLSQVLITNAQCQCNEVIIFTWNKAISMSTGFTPNQVPQVCQEPGSNPAFRISPWPSLEKELSWGEVVRASPPCPGTCATNLGSDLPTRMQACRRQNLLRSFFFFKLPSTAWYPIFRIKYSLWLCFLLKSDNLTNLLSSQLEVLLLVPEKILTLKSFPEPVLLHLHWICTGLHWAS